MPITSTRCAPARGVGRLAAQHQAIAGNRKRRVQQPHSRTGVVKRGALPLLRILSGMPQAAHTKDIPYSILQEILSKYKFAFTPENSIDEGYVSEKIYAALRAGAQRQHCDFTYEAHHLHTASCNRPQRAVSSNQQNTHCAANSQHARMPLFSGTIPIYIGAPNVHRFIPVKEAVVKVSDYNRCVPARCRCWVMHAARSYTADPGVHCAEPAGRFACSGGGQQALSKRHDYLHGIMTLTHVPNRNRHSTAALAEYIKKVAGDEALFKKHTAWKSMPEAEWSEVSCRAP